MEIESTVSSISTSPKTCRSTPTIIATTASMSISLVTTNSSNLFQTASSYSSLNTPTNSSNTTHSSSSTTTSAGTESSDTIVSKNQPKFGILNQTLTGRTLAFQNSWYDEFKWLHYSEDVKGVLCYTCLIAKKNDTISNFSKQSNPAFIENGFRNWKKAKEKFRKHEMCETHRRAVLQLQQSYGPLVQQQLLQFNQKSQKEAQKALLLIISSVRFLARQGLAFRGHKENEGNFWQLLKLRANE